MKRDDPLVFAEPDVDLGRVGPLLPSQAERGEGVFRGIVRSAAVADDFDRPSGARREHGGNRQEQQERFGVGHLMRYSA